MAHLVKSIIIQAPQEEVVALAFDPYRWHTWFSGLTAPEHVSGSGDVGTLVEQSYLLAGVRFPVITRVITAERKEGEALWEATIEGPFNGRQRWHYSTVAEGTLVTAEIEYTVPVALLGKFVDHLLIERIQARALEQTLDNLKMMCEVMSVQAAG